MDEKDISILMTIAEEGITSPDKIQEHTDIPKSTVHYRLNQLREEGVLTNELGNMDLSKLGLSITVISEVYAEFSEGYRETVGEKLSGIEAVNQVYFTMGDTDFIVIANLTSRTMVESLVDDYGSIDEVARTSSRFVISTIKREPNPISDFEKETLVDALSETTK
jgi:DNA-binding Lrp family transcriptional regulator